MLIPSQKLIPFAVLVVTLALAAPVGAVPRETLPRNAPSTQQQMRLELLQQVARFDAKTLRSEGAMVTDDSNGERFRFDLRTGAIHASAPDCASVVTGYTKCYFIDRAGHKYLELKRDKRTKMALRLIGSPHATHTQGVVDEGPDLGPVAWVMAQSITSPLDAVVRIRRTEAVDGLLAYELSTKRFRGSHFQPALLRIESDRLRLSERGNKTVWERGPQRIRFPAMDRVVSRRSFSIAFNALAARELARSSARRWTRELRAKIRANPRIRCVRSARQSSPRTTPTEYEHAMFLVGRC